MKALSRSMSAAEMNNQIHGVKVTTSGPSISYLFFDDDCLIFIRDRTREARQLANIIEQFGKFSGKAINCEKSALTLSPKVPGHVKNEISNILQIKRMALQEKYLGVPLLLQTSKTESFKPLLDKFKDRLDVWKPKFLNGPGRKIMNQSVLGALATHHMSVFPMPKQLMDKMDAIQRDFWWGKEENKGFYFKGWSDINLPKDLCGMNIKKSDIFNQALLAKLAWRMINQPSDSWVQILESRYFVNANFITDIVSKQGSWIWNGICRGLGIVRKHSIIFGKLVPVSLSLSGKTSGFQVEIAPPLLIIIPLLTKQ